MKKLLTLVLALAAMCLSACNYAAVDSANITEKGIKQYEEQKLNAAMATFQTASERDPNNAKPLYYMALIDIAYHDYQAAIPRLNQATGIRPDAPIYWHTLGRAYALLAEQQTTDGLYDEAVVSYSNCVRAEIKATKVDPFYAEAQLQQARCHVGAEEFQDAVDAYEASIRSNPKFKTPEGVTANYVELGQLYLKFGFIAEAFLVLNNGLLNNIGDAQLEAAEADALFEMKRYDEALGHYKSAIKILEKSGESRLHSLNAMYGAGETCFEMAKIAKSKGHDRTAYDTYNEAKKYYESYVESALSESEKLRRSGALSKIKDIEEILNSVSI